MSSTFFKKTDFSGHPFWVMIWSPFLQHQLKKIHPKNLLRYTIELRMHLGQHLHAVIESSHSRRIVNENISSIYSDNSLNSCQVQPQIISLTMYYFSISVNFSLGKFQQIPVTAGFLIRTTNLIPYPGITS